MEKRIEDPLTEEEQLYVESMLREALNKRKWNTVTSDLVTKYGRDSNIVQDWMNKYYEPGWETGKSFKLTALALSVDPNTFKATADVA
jgi:hypothetical protein